MHLYQAHAKASMDKTEVCLAVAKAFVFPPSRPWCNKTIWHVQTKHKTRARSDKTLEMPLQWTTILFQQYTAAAFKHTAVMSNAFALFYQ